MKLRLNNEKAIAVLDLLEDVSPQDVTVLRAGITKLIQSGRYKIILNITEAKHLDIETAKGILQLHQLATELKGTIMLVGHGDVVLEATRALASPPGMKHYATKEAALAAMLGSPGEKTPEQTADYTEGGDPNGKLKSKLAALQAENKALKAKTAQINGEEIRKLHFENGVFASQLAAIEQHLQTIKREKKKPFSLATIEAKMRILEDALATFLKEEGLLPKG